MLTATRLIAQYSFSAFETCILTLHPHLRFVHCSGLLPVSDALLISSMDSLSKKCINKTQLRPELFTVLQPHDIRNHFVATKPVKCAVIAQATKEGNCAGNHFRLVDIAATCSYTVSRSE